MTAASNAIATMDQTVSGFISTTKAAVTHSMKTLSFHALNGLNGLAKDVLKSFEPKLENVFNQMETKEPPESTVLVKAKEKYLVEEKN